MERKKYYIPTERELLQGIVNEQEIFVVSKDGDIVTNLKFNNGLINDLVSFAYLNDIEYKDEYEVIYSINSDYYRIKYLDQEDIESLGWKFSELLENGWKEYKLIKNEKIFTLFKTNQNDYIITLTFEPNPTSENIYTLFKGKINNKFELKKLMQMLEI
jgi:hypothetical protein